jgi:isoquinoline 1-oxidoreductase beta subunit
VWDDTLEFVSGSRIDVMPLANVYLVDNREAPVCIGETATSCVVAALTHAIFTATGKRIRKLSVANQEARIQI